MRKYGSANIHMPAIPDRCARISFDALVSQVERTSLCLFGVGSACSRLKIAEASR